MDKINILVLGGGGREHAFCWKLAKSKFVKNLFAAPGNAGTKNIATNIKINLNNFEGIKNLVIQYKIKLVIVGPEEPLVNGIHDFFLNDKKLKATSIIGPQKLGANLEGSKEFAKDFMFRHKIPTAQYASFSKRSIDQGYSFLEKMKPPYVLKANGLAAGKGVIIINDLNDAKKELSNMLIGKKFGSASKKVVIEEFLKGIELSCFVLTDGKSYVTFPMAKDYKRIGEGDNGLNTGGMGAISPVPFANDQFKLKVQKRIIEPTIRGLRRDNIPYIGFIFIGLINVNEDPYVIEYNVRMGDPETQVVIPRIQNDLVELFLALKNGNLSKVKMKINKKSAATVVAVSDGYPGPYEKGRAISGLFDKDIDTIFHAGTVNENGRIITNGGRVFALTSMGNNHKLALIKSYKLIKKIYFSGMYYRRDIGFDL